jgi:hypothetical protein
MAVPKKDEYSEFLDSLTCGFIKQSVCMLTSPFYALERVAQFDSLPKYSDNRINIRINRLFGTQTFHASRRFEKKIIKHIEIELIKRKLNTGGIINGYG